MATIAVELPPEILSTLKRSPEQFVRDMRLAAAIHWYTRGEISQGKAATIAGMSRVEFLDELARQKIGTITVDPDDLRRELERG